MMTTKELIKELQKFDPNVEIYAQFYGWPKSVVTEIIRRERGGIIYPQIYMKDIDND